MRKPEAWVDFPGYVGHYEISNYGRIRSLNRVTCDINGRKHNRKGRYLKHALNTKKYVIYGLSLNGKLKTIVVHRFVARLFVPNPNNLPEVNHIDGNKQNPYFENLEWSSSSDNQKHSYKLGLREPMQGIKSPNAKVTNEDVLKMRELRAKGMSHGNIHKLYPFMTLASIKSINNRKSWKHL